MSCEQFASEYLEKLGYRIIERNFRTRIGELDMIAEEGETLVFVEVKGRVDGGDPIESMTERKVRQVRRMAEIWLSRHNAWERELRFDVLLVRRDRQGQHSMEHLKEAF